MALPQGFVELLETHAEISIRDDVAWKKFTLLLRVKGSVTDGQPLWVPLTLEPGQKLLQFSGRFLSWKGGSTVFLEIPTSDPGPLTLSFETEETLRPEQGGFQVETFTAFRGDASARLLRRSVVARIDTTSPLGRVFSPTHPVTVVHEDRHSALLFLDVRGSESEGRFRFFYALGEIDPPRHLDAAEEAADPRQVLPADGVGGPTGRLDSPDLARELLEPRRSRPRRRTSLRR